jgi:hypothetical protein
LIGKNDLDLFPPEQAAHFMTKDREVLDGETGMLDIPEEPVLWGGFLIPFSPPKDPMKEPA